MAKARWEKHRAEISRNPPTISAADSIYSFLQDRRGKIAFTHDLADHAAREVVTWVQRFSVKGRVDQFDLYRNGTFILTGGHKKCAAAMAPKHFTILRYD